MSENKEKTDDERQKSIEKSIEAIFEKTEAREKARSNFFEVGWQYTLEIMLLTMEKHLRKHPGQLLPMQIISQEEWEFYLDVQKKLDLPPNTSAVMVTPGAFKEMALLKPPKIKKSTITPGERNAYSLIISGCRDHRIIMGVSLPGVDYVEIHVFEDRKHLADYTYNTIEECLNSLTKVIWIHFNPKKSTWTEEQIIRYTENWFAKSIDIDIKDVMVHSEYSYVHRPELINLTYLESIFKVIAATIPEEYDNLEKAIKTANKLNQDFVLGDPVITKEGILQDNKYECELLIDWIGIEIDQYLDTLEYLKEVKFPHRNIKNWEYKRVFSETAIKVYEVITGRLYPRSININ